ncbi:CgeB family protein [Dongia deserti]|uniref:CgeB family protein n=1 Tax=Dongia deserti TaxID=2268030 RepID=UPI000E65ACF2|nr:glycosyltransferase [Dongia deserti]
MKIVILGLSITSSWGNGHATTYRALVRALHHRGHEVQFLERNLSWYADNRDMPRPDFCTVKLYASVRDLIRRFSGAVAGADLVMVGSFVPDGIAVGEWATETATGTTAFYDIDTPVTLTKLQAGSCDYLSPDLVQRFDLYLSFTGGPVLDRLERAFFARRARALYCSVDPALYRPARSTPRWELGYMGTYSADRQPKLESLLFDTAQRLRDRRFVVAGAQYPCEIAWPTNVKHIEHLAPDRHAAFYNAQRFTLNITRADMTELGWSPSVRLFEAAACGTPIISDLWGGIESFFRPDSEIFLARSADDVERILRCTGDAERRKTAAAARKRVLNAHTALHRAILLERYVHEVTTSSRARSRPRQAASVA